MAMINVNRQTNDMFYRYKMPRLIAKVEGTGNGIKTVLVNVTAVAKSLIRPPTCKQQARGFFQMLTLKFLLDVTKFFGCELGAQVQMYAKEDRYIVNGAHDCEKLQSLLDGFIKRFVLCPNCDNPETKLVSPLPLASHFDDRCFQSVRKRNGGEIHQVCAACGYQGTINMASHKLTTYIFKNPPDAVRLERIGASETVFLLGGKEWSPSGGENQGENEEEQEIRRCHARFRRRKPNRTQRQNGKDGGDDRLVIDRVI